MSLSILLTLVGLAYLLNVGLIPCMVTLLGLIYDIRFSKKQLTWVFGSMIVPCAFVPAMPVIFFVVMVSLLREIEAKK